MKSEWGKKKKKYLRMVFRPEIYADNAKSMRLKFFKRSAEKFQSRIDPESEANRDLRVIFPGLAPEFGSRACPGVNTIYFNYLTFYH